MINDISLEQNLLTALLNKPEDYSQISSFFSEKDLCADGGRNHPEIFTVIRQAFEKQEEVNGVIIGQRLEALGIVLDADITMANYVIGLSNRKTKPGDVLKYARELKKLAVRQELWSTGEELQKRMESISPSASYVEIIQEADGIYNKKINHFELDTDVPVNIYDDMERIIEESGQNQEEPLYGPYPTVNRIYGSLLRSGNIVCITSRSGVGKMQPLYSKVLTPSGWKTIGEIKEGDFVVDKYLQPNKVLRTFDHSQKDVYRVHFSDGRYVDAGLEHNWEVFCRSYKNKKEGNYDWEVLTTEQIIEKLTKKTGRVYVPLIRPIEGEDIDLPIDPYVLGALIGDGCLTRGTTIESADIELIDKIIKNLGDDAFYTKTIHLKDGENKSKSSAYKLNFKSTYRRKKNILEESLIEFGLSKKLSHEKFIPKIYFSASKKQKIELIKGLMDTDGTLSSLIDGRKNGSLEYSTASLLLAKDIQSIIWSIGGICKITSREPFYYNQQRERVYCKTSYRVKIRFPRPKELFSLERKLKHLSGTYQYKDLKLRIVSIEKLVEKQDCRCLQVESEERLYVTDNYVVTHNTTMSMDYTCFIGDKYDVPVLHLDNGEMSLEELTFRRASAISGVPHYLIESGKWRNNPETVTKVRAAIEKVKSGKNKFFYYCVAGMSADEMVALANKFYYSKVGRGNRMILSFDYIKTTNQLNGNLTEWQVVGEIVDKFKKFVQKDILFENRPMVSMFTSVQSNRSGITTNKKSDQINDDEGTVSLSDRIIQFCSHMFILRKKTMDEIAEDGAKFGTHKLICIKARHLGEDIEGHLEPVKDGDRLRQNFINLSFQNFKIEERGDLRDVIKARGTDFSLDKSPKSSDKLLEF